jgi:aminoglycoside 3-N-acetyltransferase
MSANHNAGRTQSQLSDELRRVGIRAGDNLILHSSFKSLGALAGGPDMVVDAIVDVLGMDGHLLVPTFTYCLPMWNAEPFNIRETKARVGIIPETLRKRADALRSFHPTHSVAVIGPDREQLIRNHLHATPIGLDSPFARMRGCGAKILMLGTCQDTNSSLHLCEVLAGLPYVNIAFSDGQDFEVAWFINENGQTEYTQIREVPGCSRGFRAVEPLLRERGVLRDVHVAGAASQLLNLNDFIIAVSDILEKCPTILLCETPNCTICPKRRTHMRKLGLA